MRGFILFAGFEGVGVGMRMAGVDHVGGIEYDDKIASVARANGFSVTTTDVLTACPNDYPDMDLLHVSPPCPSFSQGNTNGKETANDISLARATANWIVAKLPAYFTLENVYQYRESESWRVIARTLLEHGYSFNYWHVNMADYGVPQTRKRMIVIARRDGRLPMLPPATHAENPQNGLFGSLLPWVGWYEAIEDLIPMLPDSQFAPWQLERLPEELKTMLVHGTSANLAVNGVSDPAAVVVATLHSKAAMPRAFLTDGFNAGREMTIRKCHEPVSTIDSMRHTKHPRRAFIVNDADSKNPLRDGCEPAATVVTFESGGTFSRAAVNGRIVQMTPRALARFQSFPDWYKLPESKSLACRGIGNAVPPLFYCQLLTALELTP